MVGSGACVTRSAHSKAGEYSPSIVIENRPIWCQAAAHLNHLQFHVNLGTLAVTWNSRGLLTRIDWYDNSRVDTTTCQWFALSKGQIPVVMTDLITALRRYSHEGEPLPSVPWDSIDTSGWTPFQHDVYRAISEIPHGETRTYAWVARKVGRGAATRAVGQALRKNPLPILVPCHRVVAANALGGFMGIVDPSQPELKLKRSLIEVESSYRNPMFSFLQPLGGASWGVAS